MTNPSPVENKPDNAAAAAPEDFATQVHAFWGRNRQYIIGTAVAVMLVVIGREGWDYFNSQREQSIRAEFARAGDTPDKLAAFAVEYASHPLAGVAWLRLADTQYAAHDFKSAAASYQHAAGGLTENALKSRARLGAAMSLIVGGDVAGGEAALKPLTEDESADKIIRAEACYHAATLAKDAGRSDDVRRLTDLVTRIDPTSPWAQRAFALRASLVTEAKPAPSLGLPPLKYPRGAGRGPPGGRGRPGRGPGRIRPARGRRSRGTSTSGSATRPS